MCSKLGNLLRNTPQIFSFVKSHTTLDRLLNRIAQSLERTINTIYILKLFNIEQTMCLLIEKYCPAFESLENHDSHV
jgi:hypothetical protein